MPTTYEPIATTTLGSAATNIDFSSIPATYTDLRLVIVGADPNTGDFRIGFNLNSTGYSFTVLSGNGSTASSTRTSSTFSIAVAPNSSTNTSRFALVEVDIFNYAGSTNKTVLSRHSNDRNGSGFTQSVVGLWQNTTAINAIRIAGNAIAAGTTATLYGILKA